MTSRSSTALRLTGIRARSSGCWKVGVSATVMRQLDPRRSKAVLVRVARTGAPERMVSIIGMIKRGKEPHRGKSALPGGFVRPGESLEDTAKREFKEETNLKGSFFLQAGSYVFASRP